MRYLYIHYNMRLINKIKFFIYETRIQLKFGHFSTYESNNKINIYKSNCIIRHLYSTF